MTPEDKNRHAKDLKNRLIKTGGRKSATNAELDIRRARETKLYAWGWSISAIAKETKVSWVTVKSDIIEYQKELRRREGDGIDQEKITLAEAAKIAINSARKTKNANGRAALLGKCIEASREIAILRGVRKVDGSINVNTSMTINQGTVNAYDKLDDSRLKEEFGRRRSLVQVGHDKAGKRKL